MNIPVFVYRILAPLITPSFDALKKSVSEGNFPECFKTAKFINFFKIW